MKNKYKCPHCAKVVIRPSDKVWVKSYCLDTDKVVHLMKVVKKKPYVTCSRDVLAHIDASKPVHVYRNLHRSALSIRQGGIVMCHTDNVVLEHATFVVSAKGRDRVRKEKRKNVHAYVKGTVVDARVTDVLLPIGWEEIYYNPYICDHFESQKRAVEYAEFVDIDGSSSKIDPSMLAFNLGYKNV